MKRRKLLHVRVERLARQNWRLVWLGESDPLIGRAKLERVDPVRERLRALLLVWWQAFHTAPATVKELPERKDPLGENLAAERPAEPRSGPGPMPSTSLAEAEDIRGRRDDCQPAELGEDLHRGEREGAR